MAEERPGIEESWDVADLQHLRLMALLQELVRDPGSGRRRRSWTWTTVP